MWTEHVLKTLFLLTVLSCLQSTAEQAHTYWAYAPLAKPPVPAKKDGDWSRSPVDRFILAKLESKSLRPAREADKHTLLRRVFFDLTGLPPTLEEMQTFLTDESPNAYEDLVDRLLKSPHYGERWARHWMDAVHFAETHGHDQDRIRTNAWPYRDYLIGSLNADKPYSRFVQEQVAGDVLFADDPQATIALGLIASGPWDESSLRDIREDTIDRQIGRYLDRDDMLTTVMQTFTSTTVQCARCHDHKFDPIPQRDYYALQAVFAGVDRANRVYDVDPSVHSHRQKLLRDRKRVERGDPDRLLAPAAQVEIAEWERELGQKKVVWKVIDPQTFVSAGGATLTRQSDGSVLSGGLRPDRDTYTLTVAAPLTAITSVKLEVISDESLPKKGPGRQENGNFHLSEFELLVFETGELAPRQIQFTQPSANFSQTGWPVEHAVDKNGKTAWAIHPAAGEPHEAVFELKESLTLSSNATLAFVIKQLHGEGHVIGRLRLSVTDTSRPDLAKALPTDIKAILAVPVVQRTDHQRATLAAFRLKERLGRDLAKLPKPSLVYAAATDFEPDGGLKPTTAPRQVHMLGRGDIKKPLEIAVPGALSCVSGIPTRFELDDQNDEGSRRAALARWLAHPENPLTWRSIVNRVWHHHFGRGLVETPNDFGKMGSPPSHPELLDWLARWFRDDAQGSLKKLHRLIVTSATYRQDSGFRNEPSFDRATAFDTENRLLWHMNRTRLDAEQVRDSILQVSGCLDLRMGGPSDMQFDLQPGIHVTPRVDYSKFDVSSAAARRRSAYRFLFRTLPDPFMDALDCPAGDQLTAVRNASVTVQQALAMWNNAFVAHYAARFAERLQSLASTKPEQIRLACELALCRPPNDGEKADFLAYADKHGLANLCRLMLNSNEFMFVN